MGLRLPTLLAVCVAALLSACGRPAAVPELPPFKTSSSLQDLMKFVVDPVADALWESVSAESTAEGLKEHQPSTDEEWLQVRQHAVQLVESANLLLIPGRAVTAAGRQVDDAHVPGVLDAAAIAKQLENDPAGFAAQVGRFREAAEKALQAVDAKSVQGLLEAGGRIQDACESCHVRFWYPKAQVPPGN